MGRFESEYVGIDLGFSNVVISYYDGIAKRGASCEYQEGGKLSPAFISFENADTYIVGKMAKENAVLEPNKTIGEFKKFMGKDNTLITVDGKSFEAVELSAIVLKYAIRNAEEYLEKNIEKAVITVPNTFGDRERCAVVEAGKMAGLKEVVLLDESTSSLYHMDDVDGLTGTIVTLDWGGSTFDGTVAVVGEDVIDVVRIDGDGQLGGKDVDNALANYIKEKYLQGKTFSKYDEQQFVIDVEKAKIALSKKEKTRMILNTEEDKFSITITRNEYETCTRQILEKVKAKAKAVLDGVKPDKVYVVGGSTKMPQFRKMIAEILPDVPIVYKDSDESVACGAATYGKMLANKEKVLVEKHSYRGKELKNISARGYGIEVLVKKTGEKQICNLIKKGVSLPKEQEKIFYTGEENPDKEIELKIYETTGDKELEKIEDSILLGVIKIKKGGNLEKYSPLSVKLVLGSDGILQAEGEEPKWKTSGSEKFHIKGA